MTTLRNGGNITGDGDFYIDMQSQFNLTIEGTWGSGTINIYQGDSSSSAQSVILSGSSAYTADFSIACACGKVRVNLSGSTSPDLDVFITPIYSTP